MTTTAMEEVLTDADLLEHIFYRIIDDPDPEVAARALAGWCALNHTVRDACDASYDAVWKELLERHFKPLLDFKDGQLRASILADGQSPGVYVTALARIKRESEEHGDEVTFICSDWGNERLARTLERILRLLNFRRPSRIFTKAMKKARLPELVDMRVLSQREHVLMERHRFQWPHMHARMIRLGEAPWPIIYKRLQLKWCWDMPTWERQAYCAADWVLITTAQAALAQRDDSHTLDAVLGLPHDGVF